MFLMWSLRPVFFRLLFFGICFLSHNVKYIWWFTYKTEGVFKIKSNSGQWLIKNTVKVVKSLKRTSTMSLVAISSSVFGPFFIIIFFFLEEKGKKTERTSPPPTLGAFRRSRGFCLGTKRGLGGFVRVLFVEVELSKNGCFPSLWWKQSVVFGKLLALCTSSVSVVEDFFSQGFFSRSSWPEWIALQCVHALSPQALQVAHIE